MTPDAATELQGQGPRTLVELANLAARDPQRAHDVLQGVLGSPQSAQEAMQASSVFCAHRCVHACTCSFTYVTCHHLHTLTVTQGVTLVRLYAKASSPHVPV